MVILIVTNSACTVPLINSKGNNLAIESYFDQNDNFDCKIIPQTGNYLCSLETTYYDNVLMSDVHFYLISDGLKTELHSHQVNQSVSTFAGFSFSTNGKYLYLSWADEGHPYFVFYNSRAFINQQINPTIGSGFEDYYLEEIVGFDDQGNFVYEIMSQSNEQCITGKETDCQKSINIFN